ncbi:hypothetical protein MNBD_GAMMA11-3086 [hydrothermal vent metagenome]|uniref:Protein Smg homolog n=1 Tax=hydrothermal vent metagenome TaxID=652676 RepID=A0A3B0Y6T4_9ZZZZ
MKQNVVDVLMYLFENIITNENIIDENPMLPEHEQMFDRLEGMGFPQREILLAFDWLEDLAEIHTEQSSTEYKAATLSPSENQSVRIYSELEKMLLGPECISFLIYIEQNQVITPLTREVILDRVIALGVGLELEQLKWIVMIVLYSQPGEENAYSWMESLIFDTHMSYMQ